MRIKSILLLLRTARYLTIKQLFYQTFYRVKPAKPLSFYEKSDVLFKPLKFSFPCFSSNCYLGNNTFSFLNKSKEFGDMINWNFQGFGKLWNYNLQYFTFLQHPQISNNLKNIWLTELANSLKTGKLKLEPYPVSLRVMNTIRYFSVNKVQTKEIISDAYAQLNFLSTRLEYHLMGNHLLENGFALLMGGHAFREDEWIEKGRKILYKELDEQILDDGGHFELSPMYHQIILFRLLELIDWYRHFEDAGKDFLQFVKGKALLMLNWLKVISFRTGDIPYLNDSTPDITFRSQVLFSIAGDLELQEHTVVPLKKSGYRKFDSDLYECVVDAGSIAARYQAGHTHADIFSFVLHIRNIPVVVDCGTSTYENGRIRNFERSTRAHNTVEIENENQIEVWDSFRVGRRPQVKIIRDGKSKIAALHDGYKRRYNIIHEREFEFKSETIKIRDAIANSGNVKAKFYIHFHPECVIMKEGSQITVDGLTEIRIQNYRDIKLDTYRYVVSGNLYKEAKVLIIYFTDDLITTFSIVHN